MKSKLSVSTTFSQNPLNSDTMLARVTVTAPLAPKDSNRHLAFLLDVSGSMLSTLNAVKAATIRIIENLKPGDTFEIISFNDRATQQVLKTKRNNETAYTQAISKINQLSTGGGTNIESSINLLNNLPSGTNVVLLTDGQDDSSISLADGAKAVEDLKKRHPNIIPPRILPIGFGTDYEVDRLKTLGDKVYFHIMDLKDVDNQFESIATQLIPLLGKGSIQLTVNGKEYPPSDLGCIVSGGISERVFEIPMPKTDEASYSLNASVTQNNESSITTSKGTNQVQAFDERASYLIFQNKIAEYKETLTQTATQADLRRLLDKINQSGINENNRQNLLGIIDALLSKNENRIREANAIMSQEPMSNAPSLPGRSKASISYVPTIPLSRSTHTRNTTANTTIPNALEINGKNYLILTRSVNFAALPENCEGVISLHPNLSAREAITVRPYKLMDDVRSLEASLKLEEKDCPSIPSPELNYQNYKEAHKDNWNTLTLFEYIVKSVEWICGNLSNLSEKQTKVDKKIEDHRLVFRQAHGLIPISLQEFIAERLCLPRHATLTLASRLGRMIKERTFENIKNASVRVARGCSNDLSYSNMAVLFSYDDVETGLRKRILTDMALTGKKSYTISDPEELNTLRAIYKEAGHEGLFDDLFEAYELIPCKTANFKSIFSSSLICLEDDEFTKIATNNGLICPISGELMQEPVRIRLEDGNNSTAIYEKTKIQDWLSLQGQKGQKLTDPATRYSATNTLVPVTDIKKRTALLLYCYHHGMKMSDDQLVDENQFQQVFNDSIAECEKELSNNPDFAQLGISEQKPFLSAAYLLSQSDSKNAKDLLEKVNPSQHDDIPTDLPVEGDSRGVLLCGTQKPSEPITNENLPSLEKLKAVYSKHASWYSLRKHYLFSSCCSFFSSSAEDVINDMKARAQENPDGASQKTLVEFGLISTPSKM